MTNGNGNDATAAHEKTDYHRQDEQVNMILDSYDDNIMQPVRRKYVRCSAYTTVTHIKKYVSFKLHGKFDDYKNVSALSLITRPQLTC